MNEKGTETHQTLEIFNKIHNCHNYLKEIFVYENSQNQKLIIFLLNWLDILAEELRCRIIESQLDYSQPDKITDYLLGFDLGDSFEAFQAIQKNLTYFHKLEVDFGINEMINEIKKHMHSNLKNKQFFIETVSEYNFSEEVINVPETDRPLSNQIEQTSAELPNILAMTSIYHANPLMWPLIAHEIGHVVFKSDPVKDFIKDSISEIIPQIAIAGISQEMDLNEVSRNIFEEIFSDLFSLRAFGSVYIVAFYFHEIIGKLEKELFGAKEKDKDRWVGHKFRKHPPSFIRMILMCKEMGKIDLEDDSLFVNLMNIERRISSYSTKFDTMDGFEKKYEIYKFFYEKASEIFNLPDIEIVGQYNVVENISQLAKHLSSWLPIPVTRLIDRPMLIKSFEEKELIEIDNPNNIRDIIYAGWIYLIDEMIPSIEEISSNRNEELILDKPARGTYSWKYNFLIQNLVYSINTSIILQNYKGED